MERTASVLGVGAGTAAVLYLDLVRAGISNITVVDFDVVESKNLSTQAYHPEDIGWPKAVALERKLRHINPTGSFQGVNANFLEMSETDVERLAAKADVLVFATDDFHAQARGNLLSLKTTKPAVFSSIYHRARCAEIFFSIPGVTPACYRCATTSRYEAYEEGYKNLVTSDGATVFHAAYVNAVVGMLTLAITHRDSDSPTELTNWFGEIWTHNLLLLQMHPQYGRESAGMFRRSAVSPGDLNFGCHWRHVEPKCPPKFKHCPDCHGTGDLRAAAGFIMSTLP